MPLLQDYNKLFEHTDNIKKVYVNNNVVWPAALRTGPDYTEPFYVEDLSGSSNNIVIKKASSSSPTLTVEYSTDKINWTSITTSTSNQNIPVAANGKTYLRCKADTWCVHGGDNNNRFPSSTGIFAVGGNVMSLLYGDEFTGNETEFPSQTNSRSAFRTMFYQNTNIKDASNLLLPATTLLDDCYRSMFNRSGLITGPELPAQTLVTNCYWNLFYGCTSLNYIKCLAVNGIDTNGSTNNWHYNVASNGTFVKATGSVWQFDAQGIPSGWTVEEV